MNTTNQFPTRPANSARRDEIDARLSRAKLRAQRPAVLRSARGLLANIRQKLLANGYQAGDEVFETMVKFEQALQNDEATAIANHK